MILPKRPLRMLVMMAAISILVLVHYSKRGSSSTLSENANPENAKDMNGNTKEPDLAPGVGAVIDSHRGEGHEAFDFPAIIHQTAPVETPNPATLSWYYANVGEEHKFYNNRDALAYVKEWASDEVYEVYHALSDPVARADMFRYLVLQREGGIYADIDTTTLCQANAWIPKEFDPATINLVIGIEVDEPTIKDLATIESWGWAYNFQFVQWVIMAKPKQKVLANVIDKVVEGLSKLAKQRRVTLDNLDLTPMDIIRTTGPGAFTSVLLEYLGIESDSPLRGLTKPVQIKDVLIMPVSAFAPNQRHSNSKSVTIAENIPEVFVMHGFQASRSWADEMKLWLMNKIHI